MRAGFYMGDLTYEVHDVPEPEPKGNEAKIRIAWCGLCGTDLHKFRGKNGSSVVVPPVILGHEVSGVVVSVGPDCTDFKPGDRVACDPNYICGECEWCKRGLSNFCSNHTDVSRGFQDFVCTPQSNVYHLPDGLDLEEAAFAEPLSCAIHGLDLLQMRSGSTVALFGMGSVGSLMLQLVLMSGAGRVIVCEREQNKRELALAMGADVAVTDAEIEDVCSKVNVDYVIECIGLKPTMEQAIRVAGKGGKVLLFGLGDPEKPIAFNQYDAFTKELAIFTSKTNPATTERAVALLASGHMDVRRIVSAELDLEDMGPELRDMTNARRGKVMVRLSGEH